MTTREKLLFPQRIVAMGLGVVVLFIACVCLTALALVACRPSLIPTIWHQIFDL
jgi:hypothetical protein